eukprot:6463527-Amphidinium_carterae.1
MQTRTIHDKTYANAKLQEEGLSDYDGEHDSDQQRTQAEPGEPVDELTPRIPALDSHNPWKPEEADRRQRYKEAIRHY